MSLHLFPNSGGFAPMTTPDEQPCTGLLELGEDELVLCLVHASTGTGAHAQALRLASVCTRLRSLVDGRLWKELCELPAYRAASESNMCKEDWMEGELASEDEWLQLRRTHMSTPEGGFSRGASICGASGSGGASGRFPWRSDDGERANRRLPQREVGRYGDTSALSRPCPHPFTTRTPPQGMDWRRLHRALTVPLKARTRSWKVWRSMLSHGEEHKGQSLALFPTARPPRTPLGFARWREASSLLCPDVSYPLTGHGFPGRRHGLHVIAREGCSGYCMLVGLMPPLTAPARHALSEHGDPRGGCLFCARDLETISRGRARAPKGTNRMFSIKQWFKRCPMLPRTRGADWEDCTAGSTSRDSAPHAIANEEVDAIIGNRHDQVGMAGVCAELMQVRSKRWNLPRSNLPIRPSRSVPPDLYLQICTSSSYLQICTSSRYVPPPDMYLQLDLQMCISRSVSVYPHTRIQRHTQTQSAPCSLKSSLTIWVACLYPPNPPPPPLTFLNEPIMDDLLSPSG